MPETPYSMSKRQTIGRLAVFLAAAGLATCALATLASARAQLLSDAAPYFLWSDAWSGTITGKEEITRDMSLHGAHVTLDNTTSASATVDYNQFNGRGAVQSWQGQAGKAHLAFEGVATMHAAGGVGLKSTSKGQGDVNLDPSYSRNGVMIDAAHWTYAVAFQTCSPPKYCDKISVTQTTSVGGAAFGNFGNTAPDEEGVQDIAMAPLPKPGQGLRGHDENATPVAGGTTATSLDYHLTPRFDIDAWAAAYRAGYIKARQSRLDAFKTVIDSKCHQHFWSMAFSTVCRAKDREKEALSEDADVATSDFKRVVTALISEQCPGFTMQLNKALGRTKDVVIDGPIATYEAVRKVLQRAVVSDPHVSYKRLPNFMQACLYDYDTFKNVMTLRLPGTLNYSF